MCDAEGVGGVAARYGGKLYLGVCAGRSCGQRLGCFAGLCCAFWFCAALGGIGGIRAACSLYLAGSVWIGNGLDIACCVWITACAAIGSGATASRDPA